MPVRHWWKPLADAGEDGGGSMRRAKGVGLAVIAVAAAVLALGQTGPWRLLEARTFDFLTTVMPPPLPAAGPIIVAIDEPSFAELKQQWPWPRDLHARLIKALRKAGAKAIGLDIIFAEPSPAEGVDAALAEALGPDVVLAGDETLISTPQADQVMRVEPLREFSDAGAVTGIASIVLDGDGTMRRLPRYADGFASMLLSLSGAAAAAPPPGALLQVFGPARTYPTVSYYQALNPDEFLPRGIFESRPVIVGLSLQSAPKTDAGGSDAFATSQTLRTGRLVPGAEIHATIFDNLRTGLFVRPVGALPLAMLVVLAAGTAGLAVRRETGWKSVLQAVGAVCLLVAGSFVLLRFGRIFFPPLAPSLAFAAVAGVQGARDYAAEYRLRRGITRAFSQYLSPVLVERLARDPSQLRLGGEQRVLTVMFCDVRGFTTIAEGMKDDPQRLTSLVNRLLDPLSEVILAAGGTIDKYIGDAIMAFWNAPLDDPDHAVHAVGAAVDMIKALDGLNAELAAEAGSDGGPPIQLRIGVGVNTGACVVGNLGSDLRFNYSALGDPVNLASRLEGQTKIYNVPILLGAETARLVAGRFSVVELDRVLVKGKAELQTIATVLPAIEAGDRAEHGRFLDDLYSGRHGDATKRTGDLAMKLPVLAPYYDSVRSRVKQEL
jgi:adenylate cyclase